MKDPYKREIDYLRISVTDRCNLRCTYCMPAEGIRPKGHREILTMEEIVRLVGIWTGAGVRRIRLTGGEPLVRRDVETLVAGLRALPGIETITMTTNGIRLAPMARTLKESGLDRVNVSLDTLDPDRYRTLTRCGDLGAVLEGIGAAQAAGLVPVKINVVAMQGVNDTEIGDFLRFAVERSLEIRFIELMPIGESGDSLGGHVPISRVLAEARRLYELREQPRERAGPAVVYQLGDTGARLGVIGALSSHFCIHCNRMRLTAEGTLRPCLYSAREYDVRALLRGGADDARILALYRQAVAEKPQGHCMETEHYGAGDRGMSQIGG